MEVTRQKNTLKNKTTGGHLYFPLKKLSKNESIFQDRAKGKFTEKYKEVFSPIIGKQLAVNTYYANDLIAPANTRISIDLLKTFDELKINFKVNRHDVTEEERNHVLDVAMTHIIRIKRNFLDTVKTQQPSLIQNSVKEFLTNSLENNRIEMFHDHYEELKGYLEFANSVITSDTKHIGTAAALKKVIENEKRIFDLGDNETGETIEHVIKTAWVSLVMAEESDDFSKEECKTLSIICMGHDGGKALIPEKILYKIGRLTQVENDIMKTHVLLSYLLSSNNQKHLDFEAFAMALHHIKENKNLPQSYSIASDTHTSFFEYLTTEAQVKLNEIYYSTRKYYRLISIADTFEAITAERIYKKASSIGKTLDIMVKNNRNGDSFYQPYLDVLIKSMLGVFLPKNLKFAVTDELLDECYQAHRFVSDQRDRYKKDYTGLIINSCSTLEEELECVIYNTLSQKVERRLNITPMFFLKNTFFK